MQTPEMPVLPLRDIKLPSEPGFWPLAPGWWVVIAVLTVLLIWLCIKWFQHLRKKRRWQDIDQQLSTIEFNFKKHQNKRKLLADLSEFLRRFVKFQLQDDHAVTLTGEPWVNYLNQLQEDKLFAPYSTVLSEGVFQHNPDFQTKGLLETTRAFIKRHVMRPTKKNKKTAPEVSHV